MTIMLAVALSVLSASYQDITVTVQANKPVVLVADELIEGTVGVRLYQNDNLVGHVSDGVSAGVEVEFIIEKMPRGTHVFVAEAYGTWGGGLSNTVTVHAVPGKQ